MENNRPQDALASVAEGIALLIELAEKGEINPWDVQVIDVIDRYLSQLSPGHDAASTDANLSQSGQAFLYASMLVLLKAESLVLSEETEENGQELEPGEDSNSGRLLPQHLERQLKRRAVAQVPRRRRVTLDELIAQLQLMATTIQEKAPVSRPRPTRAKARSEAAKAIAELAPQENLVEIARELDKFLTENSREMGEKWLDIEELLQRWDQSRNLLSITSESPTLSEEHSLKKDRVGVFWALLLLCAQSKVELSQDEFYQDLKIRTLGGVELTQTIDRTD
jgi:segregation and condensation protein A